nr:MAG TPA: hypothetical protein [Caudoviricetes sp.]
MNNIILFQKKMLVYKNCLRNLLQKVHNIRELNITSTNYQK